MSTFRARCLMLKTLNCWASFVPRASRECSMFPAMYHGHVPRSRNALRELARSMSVSATKRLEQIALHGSETAAVHAIEVILDCAFGKPLQRVTQYPGVVVELPAKEETEPPARNRQDGGRDLGVQQGPGALTRDNRSVCSVLRCTPRWFIWDASRCGLSAHPELGPARRCRASAAVDRRTSPYRAVLYSWNAGLCARLKASVC